jgi:PIN domain nuclease of toxin-antitoxin system
VKLLLDTRALLWWQTDDPQLGRAARSAIADPAITVLVSDASLWEIDIKVRAGKLQVDPAAVQRASAADGFERLAISPAHIACIIGFSAHHRDPFDRPLVAQAIVEAAVLVTDDAAIPLCPVQTLGCR